MKPCLCGCGRPALKKYLPGHDQKLRIAIETELGGLERLREIAEAIVGHPIIPGSVAPPSKASPHASESC